MQLLRGTLFGKVMSTLQLNLSKKQNLENKKEMEEEVREILSNWKEVFRQDKVKKMSSPAVKGSPQKEAAPAEKMLIEQPTESK